METPYRLKRQRKEKKTSAWKTIVFVSTNNALPSLAEVAAIYAE